MGIVKKFLLKQKIIIENLWKWIIFHKIFREKISSKLIEETSKILFEKNKNIKSEKQYLELSNLDDIFNKKNNKR